MTVRHRYLLRTLVLLPATLIALGGCDGDSGTDSARPGNGPSVIAPGKPGEASETLSAEEARRSGERKKSRPNSADHEYVTMMIEHHEQALVMTDLATEHAHSAQVGRLAKRIAAAQKPEIGAMRGWLEANPGDPDSENHGGGDHDGHGGDNGQDARRMPGMATEAQLKELRTARGADFDRLFLTLMIAHHQGAVAMAKDVAAEGSDVQVGEMAGDVAVQQTAEINRMRAML